MSCRFVSALLQYEQTDSYMDYYEKYIDIFGEVMSCKSVFISQNKSIVVSLRGKAIHRKKTARKKRRYLRALVDHGALVK